MNRGSAFVADAVTVTAASEHHVSGVENVGGVVVGNNGLAVEQVVELGIVGVVVFGNHAAVGQFDGGAHGGLAVGLVRVQKVTFGYLAFYVARIAHVLQFHFFFFAYHNILIYCPFRAFKIEAGSPSRSLRLGDFQNKYYSSSAADSS